MSQNKVSSAIVATLTLAIGIFATTTPAFASSTSLSSTVTTFNVGETTPAFSVEWALPGGGFLANLIFAPKFPLGVSWSRDQTAFPTCSATYPGGALADCGIDSVTVNGTTQLAKANKTNGDTRVQVVLDSSIGVSPGDVIVVNFKQGFLASPTSTQVGIGSFGVTTNMVAINPTATQSVTIAAAQPNPPAPNPPAPDPSSSGTANTASRELATTGFEGALPLSVAAGLLFAGASVLMLRKVSSRKTPSYRA